MDTLRKIILGVFLTILVVFVTATLVLKYNEGFQCFLLKEETVYTDRYTEQAFRGLRIGVGTQEVENVLGLPFRKVQYEEGGEIVSAWVYSSQNPTSAVQNFRKRVVEFDEKGRVFRKETGLYVD